MSTSQKMSAITLSNRAIHKFKIEENFLCIRGLSPKRLRFEIEYGLERGSSVNSFIYISEINPANELKTALIIHPPGESFGEIFLEVLEKEITEDVNQILVIASQINPNRVSLLKRITKLYPNLTLICSTPGAKLLKDIWNRKQQSKEMAKEKGLPMPAIQAIKTKERLYINNKLILHLIPTPTARWPGGLMAFEESLGLLMSDKLFGAHIYTKEWAEINSISTEEERRHYFDSLMASITSQIDSIIEQLEDLDIRTIAPCHGPAIESSWRSLLNDYRRWGEGKESQSIKVILLFASAYGNTATIADAIARGVSRTGIKVESINCEFTQTSHLIQSIKDADGYLIGSPTLGGHAPTPIVSALGALLAEGDRANPIGVFGSYGWSGEAIELLENKLRDGGFKFGFKTIKIKFSPDNTTTKTLEETGTLFGRNLIKTKQREIRRTTGGLNVSKSDPAVLALGRIVGSLCVLAARKGTKEKEISSAMIASWVSQASFSPPGISIAVAKDRAVENLLHVGDSFVLNILSTKKHQQFLKQFLKNFSPGEDRFSGVNIENSPGNQPILSEGLAWLEACVDQRIECGDHWLIYAEVKYGKIIDPEGTTAIHHRRSGASY